jgi:nitroreductase
MDLFEAMMTTRAIRRFTDEPISDEELWTCLSAAVQAPSGGNSQPWRFLIVTDPEIRRAIGEVYARAWARYHPAVLKVTPPAQSESGAQQGERMLSSAQHLADHIGEAPAMALVLMPAAQGGLRDEEGELDIGTPFASIFPAVQNFMLAARGLGIGTTLTTLYRIYQDDIRKICDIPQDFEVVALLPMGRPRGKFGVAPRRPAEKVTYWNRFGEHRER